MRAPEVVNSGGACIAVAPQGRSTSAVRRVRGELEQLLEQVKRERVDYERLAMRVVASEPWSVENGLLTPTMKLKRSRIEAAVEAQVAAWYARGERVVWA